ncbi:hypothetical protein EST38_g6404 [Candolleomyces aberdarensis]|uniref:Cytochrome P450 n=1 Tax=Candolleomyces aberdarensis TaxID=2316362 RepID=A0A4Q2DHQ1_9AGAR|nr:hypothetical protein EST38_g6404 [Candolleomyces aberdarensis]
MHSGSYKLDENGTSSSRSHDKVQQVSKVDGQQSSWRDEWRDEQERRFADFHQWSEEQNAQVREEADLRKKESGKILERWRLLEERTREELRLSEEKKLLNRIEVVKLQTELMEAKCEKLELGAELVKQKRVQEEQDQLLKGQKRMIDGLTSIVVEAKPEELVTPNHLRILVEESRNEVLKVMEAQSWEDLQGTQSPNKLVAKLREDDRLRSRKHPLSVQAIEYLWDMIYLNAPGVEILVLGSQRRAVDLLDRRSANYSDRPVFPITDLSGFGWAFGVMPYGAMWRQHSRTFRKYFSHSVVQQYHPIMYEETKAFLRKVNLHPNHIFEDLQFLFGATLMRVAYGFDDNRRNEALIGNGVKLVTGFTDAAIPGRFLVNSLPALRHIPSWFPGAGFKEVFRELSDISSKTLYPPFEEARSNFVRNSTVLYPSQTSRRHWHIQAKGVSGKHPSVAADLIDSLPEKSDEKYAMLETVARNVCAVGYVAGADTTSSWATALLYVLASYSEVQTKAQTEIDTVVGSDRLPLVTDREGLPYVHAIVKEVGRWYTVVPLGMAHSNTEDDEYDGYFIPKGTIIFQNNWAMMHDPDVFDKPFEFVPERYIKDGKIDPSVPDADRAAFGHGRRNDALFVMAASFLATHTIAAPKDEQGKIAPMNLEGRNLAICKPLPFKCEITPTAMSESTISFQSLDANLARSCNLSDCALDAGSMSEPPSLHEDPSEKEQPEPTSASETHADTLDQISADSSQKVLYGRLENLEQITGEAERKGSWADGQKRRLSEFLQWSREEDRRRDEEGKLRTEENGKISERWRLLEEHTKEEHRLRQENRRLHEIEVLKLDEELSAAKLENAYLLRQLAEQKRLQEPQKRLYEEKKAMVDGLTNIVARVCGTAEQAVDTKASTYSR